MMQLLIGVSLGTIFALLVLVITPNDPQAAPAPRADSVVKPADTTSVPTSSTTSTYPAPKPFTEPAPRSYPVNAIGVTEYCAEGFCASFPTVTGLSDIDVHPPAPGLYGQYGANLLFDDLIAQVCIGLLSNPACPGASAREGYSVHVMEAPGQTADQALAAVEAKLIPRVFTDVHRGTLAGAPAVFSTFHTREGGSGPYADVYYNGKVYSVWANGQTTGARFGSQFQASFRFVK